MLQTQLRSPRERKAPAVPAAGIPFQVQIQLAADFS
jgi:hypothetical protein